MKMFRTKLLAGLAAALAMSSAAQAAVTFTSVEGPDVGAPTGYTIVLNYDGIDSGFFTESGGNIGTTPGVENVYAPPLGTTPGTFFKYVGNGESYTLEAPLITGFSVFIGSVDWHNNIAFYNGATLLGAFTGNDLTPPVGYGSQVDPFSNRRFTFNFNGDTATSIVFSGLGEAMEFDSLAVPSAIPEPATWAMMITGFGLLGAAMRRRRRDQAVGAATA